MFTVCGGAYGNSAFHPSGIEWRSLDGKGRYGSFHSRRNVWLAGKTVWSLEISATCRGPVANKSARGREPASLVECDPNWCSWLGIWIMMNARGGWKLVKFDLDLWPRELFFRNYLSYNLWTASPSNFVFGLEMRLDNIYAPIQFQGHRAKVKVTAAKTAARRFIPPSNTA